MAESLILWAVGNPRTEDQVVVIGDSVSLVLYRLRSRIVRRCRALIDLVVAVGLEHSCVGASHYLVLILR